MHARWALEAIDFVAMGDGCCPWAYEFRTARFGPELEVEVKGGRHLNDRLIGWLLLSSDHEHASF